MRWQQARTGLAQAASSALTQAGRRPPERQFLRMASSAFPGSRKGHLRKASLICIKSCRLRGAVQLLARPLWRNGVQEKPGELTACRAFCAH